MTTPTRPVRAPQLLADASAMDLGWSGKQERKRLLPDPHGRNDGRWHKVELAGGGSIDVRFARWKGQEPVFEAKGQSATIMKLEGFQSFSAAASNAAERTRGGALKPVYPNPLQAVAGIQIGNQTLGQIAQSGLGTAGKLLQNTPIPVLGVTPTQAASVYNTTADSLNRASTTMGGKPVLPKVPEPQALKTYQAQIYGGTVTARPLPLSADGRQRWSVQWEGRQGITNVEVQLKGQFGSRQLANGSYTKNAIGNFVNGVNQHWAQVSRQEAQNAQNTQSARTQPSASEQRTWAAQAAQTVQNLPSPAVAPVQLNALDPALGLAKGPPKDWVSQGLTGFANGLGNLVGDLAGLPEDSDKQKRFAHHRASVALHDLTKANIPVNDQGRFNLPNTEEAGRFFAALVAQSGQAGDPSGTGFAQVQRVGLALDNGLAQRYGLSPQFVQGFKKAQDQMALSGLYQAAQTLSSLAPMMASRSVANRPTNPVTTPQVDVVHGARTHVKPNAAPIAINPLQPPVVKPTTPPSKRLTPNVEFSGNRPPPQLPQTRTQTRTALPDANTIDITPISSQVVKPVRSLPSQEMRNAIPNPLTTPINRPAVPPAEAGQGRLRGNGQVAPQLGSGSPRLPGGGNAGNSLAGTNTAQASLPQAPATDASRPLDSSVRPLLRPATTAPQLGGNVLPGIAPSAVRALPPGISFPVPTPPQRSAQNPWGLSLGQEGDHRVEPQPLAAQEGGGGNKLPPALPPRTGGSPDRKDSDDGKTSAPTSGGMVPAVPPDRTAPPKTLLPLPPEPRFNPSLPEPEWLRPVKADGDLPPFMVPRPSAKRPATEAAGNGTLDATAMSRASGTPSPGLQTYFGLRNIEAYNHPETGALHPLLPGHETQLTIPEHLNIHRDPEGTLVINHPLTGRSWNLHEAAKQFPGKVFIASSPTRELVAEIEKARVRSEAAALAARAGGPPPKSVLTVLGQAEAKIPTLGSVRLRINGTEGAKVAAELAKLSFSPSEWTALFNGDSSPRLKAALQHLATKGFELKVTASSLDVPGGQKMLRRDDVIEVPLPELLRSRFFVSSQAPRTNDQPSLPDAQGTFTLPRPSDLALYRFNGREVAGTQMVEYLGEPLTLVVKRTTGVDLSPSTVVAAKGAIEAQHEVKIRPGDLLPKSMVDKLSHQLTDTGTYSLEIKDGKIFPQVNFRNDYARIIPSRTGLATTNWMDWLVPRQAQADQPKKIVVTGLGKLMGQSAGAVFGIDPKLIGSRGQTGIGGATAQQLWKLAELTRAVPPRGSEPESTLPLNQLMAEMPGSNPLQPGHVPLVNVNLRFEADAVHVDFSGLETSALSRYTWQDEALLRVQSAAPTQAGATPGGGQARPVYVKVPAAILHLMTNRGLTADQGQVALQWLRANLPGRMDPTSEERLLSPSSQALLKDIGPQLSAGSPPGAVSAASRTTLLNLLFGGPSTRP